VWSRCTDDLDTSRAAVRRCITRAREAGEDYMLLTFLSYLAATEEMAGDFAAAAAALAEADQVTVFYDWQLSAWHLEPRCELLIAAGDQDQALALADEHLPDEESEPLPAQFVGACVRGKVSMWRGDTAATIRHLERAARLAGQCDWAEPGVRSRIDHLLAEAYIVAGRVGDAEQISAWLGELGLRLGRPALAGDAHRIDALLAAQAGDLDTAAAAARAAVAAHQSSPLRLELARSLLVLGRIERRRKARRQSRQVLARARELGTEIGHRPLLAAIEKELPQVAAERSGTELTATERRVADLIAAGSTNRDTAAVLFVSVRTVDAHVASIYRKLGVRTRAELARRIAAQ
jgi:DNA-binding CsgD family transcriptional regulator